MTDEDYQEVVDLQDIVLLADERARVAKDRLRGMLAAGAQDCGRAYYFDQARNLVRRRERSEVGS